MTRAIRWLVLSATLLTGACSTIVGTAPFPTGLYPQPELQPDMRSYYSLPVAYYPIQIACQKNAFLIAVGAASMVPDPGHRYAIEFYHNNLFTDTLDVQTDSTGLLASVGTSSENQVGKIVTTALEIATNIIKLENLPRLVQCDEKHTFDFMISTDPTSNTSVAGAEAALNEVLAPFDVAIQLVVPDNGKEASGNKPKCVDEQERSGLCYRPAVLRTLRISFGAKPTENEKFQPFAIREFKLVAPDSYQLIRVPLDRGFFAKFDVTMTFDKGMLKQFKTTNTSEVLAALQLPLDIVKGLVGLDTSSSGSAAAAPSKSGK